MNAYIICTLKWFWCIYTCMSPNYIHIHVHTYNIYNTNILSVYMFHSNGLGKIFSLVESRLRLWSYFVQSHSYFIIITMSFNFLWKMKKKNIMLSLKKETKISSNRNNNLKNPAHSSHIWLINRRNNIKNSIESGRERDQKKNIEFNTIKSVEYTHLNRHENNIVL